MRAAAQPSPWLLTFTPGLSGLTALAIELLPPAFPLTPGFLLLTPQAGSLLDLLLLLRLYVLLLGQLFALLIEQA